VGLVVPFDRQLASPTVFDDYQSGTSLMMVR
jgi:hypothetical protein